MDDRPHFMFPMPQRLSEEDRRLLDRFRALSAEARTALLWDCRTYEEFRFRLAGALK